MFGGRIVEVLPPGVPLERARHPYTRGAAGGQVAARAGLAGACRAAERRARRGAAGRGMPVPRAVSPRLRDLRGGRPAPSRSRSRPRGGLSPRDLRDAAVRVACSRAPSRHPAWSGRRRGRRTAAASNDAAPARPWLRRYHPCKMTPAARHDEPGGPSVPGCPAPIATASPRRWRRSETCGSSPGRRLLGGVRRRRRAAGGDGAGAPPPRRPASSSTADLLLSELHLGATYDAVSARRLWRRMPFDVVVVPLAIVAATYALAIERHGRCAHHRRPLPRRLASRPPEPRDRALLPATRWEGRDPPGTAGSSRRPSTCRWRRRRLLHEHRVDARGRAVPRSGVDRAGARGARERWRSASVLATSRGR